MRSFIRRISIPFFLSVCGMAAIAAPSGFQKLEGPTGAVATWLETTAGSQFLGTYEGIYRRPGASGPWLKILPADLVSRILTRGDTVVIYSDTGYVSVDGGDSWRRFAPPDYLNRLVSLGRYGLVASVGPDWMAYRSLDLGRTWESLGAREVEGGVEWGSGWVLGRRPGILFVDAASEASFPMVEGIPESVTYEISSDGTVLLASVFQGETFRFDPDQKAWAPTGIRWARGPAFFRGDTVYQGTDSAWWTAPLPPDDFRWYRSLDQGKHWSLIKAFPASSRIDGLVPAGKDLMALVPGYGVARVGAGTELIPDNEGLRDFYLRDLSLSGSDLFAHLLVSGWIYQSQDLGAHWTLMARSQPNAGPPLLFPVGKEVFLQDPAYFGRWNASASVFDPVPAPSPDPIMGIKDGDERFFAYAARSVPQYSQSGHIQGYTTYGTLASSPKSPIQWTTLPLPGEHFTAWDVDGRRILGTDGTTLAWSREGGLTWIKLTGQPFARPNAIRFTGGNWFISSEKGVLRSADPEAGDWEPTPLASETLLLGASGSRLLARGNDKVYRLSPDLGATWLTVAGPMPAPEIHSALLSDSLLCLGGNTLGVSVRDWYCSDLETVPIPIRNAKARARPGSPETFFRGTWRLMRPPSRIGEAPRFVDPRGRAVPGPGPRR